MTRLIGRLTTLSIAITRLPGTGGHVPANGLSSGGGPTQPIELPGVLVAALATLGLGLVLGPEAPLIALGSIVGLAVTLFARVGEAETRMRLAECLLAGGDVSGAELEVHALESTLAPVAAAHRGRLDALRGELQQGQDVTAS